jgi:hypothetical protein
LEIELAAAIEVSALPTVVDAIEKKTAIDETAEEAAAFNDDLDEAPAPVYDDILEDV